MTQNQIAYREYQEQVRSHMANEAQARAELAERQRSNLISEAETYRSNVANEGIKQQQNVINQQHYERQDAETRRHDIETEYIQKLQARNQAMQILINGFEAYTKRSELPIKQQEADIKQQQADTNAVKVHLDYLIQSREVGVKEAQLGINQAELGLHKLQTSSSVQVNQSQADLNKQKIKESDSTIYRNVAAGNKDNVQAINGFSQLLKSILNPIKTVQVGGK